MRSVLPAILTLFLLFILSCENPSDLGGSYEPKMVVYAVLSTFSDTQYVRVLQTTTQSLASPNQSVNDATVEITDGNQSFSFLDTVVTHQGAASAPDSFHVYRCTSFKPLSGTTYFLHVNSPTLGIINTRTIAPAHTIISVDRPANVILRNPYASHTLQPEVGIELSPGAAAYQVHAEIEYEDISPTGTSIKRFEVPERMITLDCPSGRYEFIYPRIIRAEGTVTYLLSAFSYRRSVDFVQGSTVNWRLLRVIFTVVQFNDEWYRYFRSARLSEDRYSVRLDQPDYSNIDGGLGVFGACVVDTISTPLPPAIFNPNPKDVYPDCN